jgi:hypothetical protein
MILPPLSGFYYNAYREWIGAQISAGKIFRRMKRILFLCSVLILASTLVFAAGNRQTGSDPYANAPREVSMTILDRGVVPASEGTYEDNRWVQWINKNAPVKVSFVPVQRSNSTNRLMPSLPQVTPQILCGSTAKVSWITSMPRG